MRAKIYNKKKLFSLLVLPFMASNITAKSTLAADSTQLYSGDIYHVSGTHDSYRIFSYDTDVTVILDAAARINNDSPSPAVGLNYGSTVDMKSGSAITSLPVEGNATGVEFDNELGYTSGIIDNVTMDRATISATAEFGSAYGILSRPGSNDHNSHVTTRITLDNNSAITAEAYGQAAGVYLVGHPGDLSPYNSSAVALDHGSSITATATTYGDTAMASGIFIKDEGEVSISLDNGARINNTASSTGTSTANIDNTYGIYAESVHSASSTVSMDHGSAITTTASATAYGYAVLQSVTGVQVVNNDSGNVGVTMANGSSITDTTSATIESSETSSATRAVANTASGVNAYSYGGDTTVTLGGGSTVTVSATATNHQAGSSADRAYATNIYGIRSRSEYGNNTVTLGTLAAVRVDATASAQTVAITDAVGVSSIASGNEGFSNGDATLVMTQGASVAVTAESTATAKSMDSLPGHAYASATGANASADDGNIHVILNNSSVSAEGTTSVTTAAGASTSNSRTWVGAEGIHAETGRGGQTVVDLSDGALVSATASALNDSSAGAESSNNNDAVADVLGIYAYSDFGQVNVTLHNATVAARGAATAKGNAYSSSNDAFSYTDAIVAHSGGSDANRLKVLLNGSTITADTTATADAWAKAVARGIAAYNDNIIDSLDGGATVTLNATSVAVKSTAQSTGLGTDANPVAQAFAFGIYAESSGLYRDAEVTLNTLSSLTTTATTNASEGGARSYAHGIKAAADNGGQAVITIGPNSSVTTLADATGSSLISGSGTIADAYGIEARANGAGDIHITLDQNSAITSTARANASSPVTTDAYGIAAITYGWGLATVDMHGSTIKADAASTSDKYASAWGYGIRLANNMVSNYTGTVVNLDNSSVTTTAGSTVTGLLGGNPNAKSYAYGILANSLGDLYHDADVNLTNLSRVSASATSSATDGYARATADGIRATSKYGESADVTVTLNSLVTASATASASTTVNAGAQGILAIGAEGASVHLADSSVIASATATTTGSYSAGASAHGINLRDNSVNYTVDAILSNATVSATATASGAMTAPTAPVGITTATSFRPVWTEADAYGIDIYSWGNTDTVGLTNSQVKASATATGFLTDAEASGIRINGHTSSWDPTAASVTLDHSSVTAQATATATGSTLFKYNYAGASGILASNLGTSTIELGNGASVTATATGTNTTSDGSGGDMYTYALGIESAAFAGAYPWQYSQSTAESSITLNSATATVTATTTADDNARAYARGLKSNADGRSYQYDTNAKADSGAYTTVDLTNSTLTVSASATGRDEADAIARGLDSYANTHNNSNHMPVEADISSTIDLENSRLTSQAAASGANWTNAYASGISGVNTNSKFSFDNSSYGNSDLAITLDNGSAVSATATATSSSGDAWAKAVGINAYNRSYATAWLYSPGTESHDDLSIGLSNSSLGATATATAGGDGGEGSAIAILAYSDTEGIGTATYAQDESNIRINLDHATLTATGSFSGYSGIARATGIDSYSLAGAYAHSNAEGGYAWSATGISLNNVTFAASASAISNAIGNTKAYATGITAADDATSGDSSFATKYSYVDASITIDLNNSAFAATATARGADVLANAAGISANSTARAWSDMTWVEAYGNSDITLDNSSFSTTAAATGSMAVSAVANGISSMADSRSYGDRSTSSYSSYAEAGTTVNLSNATLTVAATANSAEQAFASSQAIETGSHAGSYSRMPSYAWATGTVTLDNSRLTSQATATGTTSNAYALAGGIDTGVTADAYSSLRNSHAESDLEITLDNNSSVAVTATAKGAADMDSHAEAVGIKGNTYAYSNAEGWDRNSGAEGHADLTISLDHSTVSATASASGYGKYYNSYAEATAIKAHATADSYGDYTYAKINSALNIDLNNAAVSATADFTGDRGWARVTGISADSWAEADTGSSWNYDMTASSYTGILLETVTLSASATATGYRTHAGAVGIDAYAGARSGDSSSFYSGAAYAGAAIDITLTPATLSASATAKGDYSSASATGIDAYSYAHAEGGHHHGSEYIDYYAATTDTSINIGLTASNITASASTAGTGANASARGIDAYAYSDSRNYVAYSSATTTITLNNSSVGATAAATGSKYISAYAGAIGIDTVSNSDSHGRDPFYSTYADTVTTVELTGSTLSASAAATSTDQAYARSQGLRTNSSSWDYSSSPASANADTTITLDHTTIASQATASGAVYASADANGISSWNGASSRSYSYNSAADSTIDLRMSNGSVNATAAAFSGGAEGCASAVALQAGNWANARAQNSGGNSDGAEATANLAITLDHAQLNASATTSAVGNRKYNSYAYATALEARTSAYANGNYTDARVYTMDGDTRLPGVNLTIDLNNATLTAVATLTGQYGSTEAIALDAYSGARTTSGSHGYDMTALSASSLILDTVTLSASATATGYADDATAYAIRATNRADARGWNWDHHEGDSYAASQLNIELHKTSASASASASGGNGLAEATGISAYAEAYASGGHYHPDGISYFSADSFSTIDLHLIDSQVSATATASGDYSGAEARGIRANAMAYSNRYLDTSDSALLVDLERSSISASAAASGNGKYLDRIHATAYGIEAVSDASSRWTNNYSNAATTVTLTDSSVSAEAAANGCYGMAEALGISAVAYSYASTSSSEGDSSTINIELTGSSVAATATANGDYGEALAAGIATGPQIFRGPGPGALAPTGMTAAKGPAIGPFGSAEFTTITLTDSRVSAEATATGNQGDATAFGIVSTFNNDVRITLDNVAISAKATSNSSNGSGYAAGVIAVLADNVTIDLSNNSSIDATGSGGYRLAPAGVGPTGGGTGIALLGVTNATINIDATSSVSGNDFAVYAMSPNATLNNYGHVAGRVNVTTLNNLATEGSTSVGTLQATLAGNDREWWPATTLEDGSTAYIANPGDPFYFTATGSATLADGTTFRIATNGNLGFTAVDQTREYRLLGVGNGITPNGVATGWDATKLNIVKYGYQSPLLQYSYDELLSDSDHIILKVKLVSPAEAGLSGNAGAAVEAALADGLLDFNSNPEQWSPEIMAKVFGAMQFIRGNLYNIENRLHGHHSGANSGDPNARNHGWLDANYTDATQSERNAIEGFDTTTKAFNIGYDRNLSADGLIGISFGYGKTDAETEFSRRTVDMDEYMLTLYGQIKAQGGWFGEGQISAGRGSSDSLRYIDATPYTASYDSKTYYAKLAGGMEIESGGWTVSPKASIDYASIKFNEYQETGGPLALTVDSDTYNSSNIGAGLQVMYKGKVATPEVGAMVYYDLIGDTIQTTSHFNGGSTYFQTRGADPARTSWELSAALTLEAPGTPLTFKVGYDMLGREDFISHNVSGKLTYDF